MDSSSDPPSCHASVGGREALTRGGPTRAIGPRLRVDRGENIAAGQGDQGLGDAPEDLLTRAESTLERLQALPVASCADLPKCVC